MHYDAAARVLALSALLQNLSIMLLLGVVCLQAQAQTQTTGLTPSQHCIGEGPPVYLIGGGPAFTTWNLEPVQAFLAASHRVCRWDMRGVGDNAELPFEPGTSVLTHWLNDMAQLLPAQPVTLWGHSWGALQVLLFARQYPERVAKIVLSNPVDPALRSLDGIEQRRFNHPDNGPGLALDDMGTPAETLHNLRSKIASYFADARRGWQYAAGFDLDDTSKTLNVRVWDDYRAQALDDQDLRALAQRISGLLYCRDDVLQPANQQEYTRLLGQDARHIVLTGCAHFPWEENPEDYYRALSSLVVE